MRTTPRRSSSSWIFTPQITLCPAGDPLVLSAQQLPRLTTTGPTVWADCVHHHPHEHFAELTAAAVTDQTELLGGAAVAATLLS
jgi:hypothetical protein